MPSSYTGNAAGITPRQAATITDIADGDALNAANLTPAPKALADLIAYLQANAVLLGSSGAISNTDAIDLTGPGEFSASLQYAIVPATRKLVASFNTSSLQRRIRVYAEGAGSNLGGGNLVITTNAVWSSASGGRWSNDIAGEDGSALLIGLLPRFVRVAAATLAAGMTDAAFWSSGALFPAAATALQNTVHPLLVSKAWGCVKTDGVGGVSLLDGANVSGVYIASNTIGVTLANGILVQTGFPCAVSCTRQYPGSGGVAADTIQFIGNNANTFSFQGFPAGGSAPQNPATTAFTFHFDIKARQ